MEETQVGDIAESTNLLILVPCRGSTATERRGDQELRPHRHPHRDGGATV